MIYKKDANFPYPILSNTSGNYTNSQFMLDVGVEENNTHYRFKISHDIDSEFINELIKKKRAQLILVIQSKDNKYFNLSSNDEVIDIDKSRISLSKRSILQLLIQSKEDICFIENNELSDFYDEFKDQIQVSKYSILGFSNTVIFEGSNRKPLELFEKKINPNLKSDIHIELGNEMIVIHYKSEDLQFVDMQHSALLNNHYVYMGLQKALYRFVINHSEDQEYVDLAEMTVPEGLDLKLYQLMKKKMVKEVSIDNIDEVIYAISDRILEKHTATIRGISHNGN